MTFRIKYILDEVGRDIPTTASKTFKVGQIISEGTIKSFCREHALTYYKEDNEKVMVVDSKNREHIRADVVSL